MWTCASIYLLAVALPFCEGDAEELDGVLETHTFFHVVKVDHLVPPVASPGVSIPYGSLSLPCSFLHGYLNRIQLSEIVKS